MNERHAPPPQHAFRLAIYGLLAVLFLVLRALHIDHVVVSPAGQVPIIDSRYYLEWAQRILDGLGLGPHPFFMSPLYPLLIAASHGLDSALTSSAFWAQSLLSLGTMLLIGRFAARRFGPWMGPVAALVYTLYAPSLYYDAILLSASMILFLTMAALTLLDDDLRTIAWWRVLAAGLAIGLSALGRPNALLLIPAFGLLFFLRGRKSSWGRIGLLVLGVAMMLLPVMTRNARMGGGFALSTNSLGVNLYIGNHEDAAGIYTEAPFLTSAEPIYEAEDYRRVASERTGKELTVSGASSYWTGQALSWIVQHPIQWAGLELRKLAYFFNRIEVANNVSMYGVAEYSPLLKALMWISFGFIAPLGLLGLLLTRKQPSTWIPIALVVSYLVANLMFFVSSEYRYPIIGILIVYAVGAVVEVVKRLRSTEPVSGIQSITALLLVLLFVNAPWQVPKRESDPAMDYFNWASVSYGDGDLTNASLLFSAALAIRPEWSEAHLQLALVFEDMGMSEMADREFSAAGFNEEQVREFRYQERYRKQVLPEELRGDPETMGASELTALGARFNQLGRSRDAARILRDALDKDSSNANTYFQFGVACERLGNFYPAIHAYERAEAMMDADPMIPYRLAWAYRGYGDRGSALSSLRRAKKKAEALPDKESREYWMNRVELTVDRFENF